MKNIIKKLFPASTHEFMSKVYNQIFPTKIPVHIQNIFGFDLYQNNNDVINYSKYSGYTLENLPSDKDTLVFKLMKIFLKDGDVAVDVGANIGLMSLVMSKLCGPNGKVISLEPGPVSSALLMRNLYVNGAISLNTIQKTCAVTDFSGTAPLFINSGGESDNQVHHNIEKYEFKNENPRTKVEVLADTLDKIIERETSYSKVRFVKIDTQGHEFFVLQGARQFIKNAPDLAILCEYAPYLKSWENILVEDFYALLIYFGFAVYDADNLEFGIINLDYLQKYYGETKAQKYTDLLLVKGKCLDLWDATVASGRIN